MGYKEKYEQALENLKRIKNANRDNKELVDFIEYQYPELKESEDENIRKQILDCFRTMKQQGCFPSKHKEQYDSWITWLEKQDPKKHEEELENAYKCADEVQYRKGYEDAKREFLKQDEQKPAWSEEDEKEISKLIKFFMWEDTGYRFTKEDCLEATNWLKNLKGIYTWKPSDEQMRILSKFNDPVLKSLYSDLQKLF